MKNGKWKMEKGEEKTFWDIVQIGLQKKRGNQRKYQGRFTETILQSHATLIHKRLIESKRYLTRKRTEENSNEGPLKSFKQFHTAEKNVLRCFERMTDHLRMNKQHQKKPRARERNKSNNDSEEPNNSALRQMRKRFRNVLIDFQ